MKDLVKVCLGNQEWQVKEQLRASLRDVKRIHPHRGVKDSEESVWLVCYRSKMKLTAWFKRNIPGRGKEEKACFRRVKIDAGNLLAGSGLNLKCYCEFLAQY